MGELLTEVHPPTTVSGTVAAGVLASLHLSDFLSPGPAPARLLQAAFSDMTPALQACLHNTGNILMPKIILCFSEIQR